MHKSWMFLSLTPRMVTKVVIMNVDREVLLGSNYEYTYTVLGKGNTFV